MIDFLTEKKLPERLLISDAALLVGELISDTLKNAASVIQDMTSHLEKAQGKGIRTTLLLHCAADEEGFVKQDSIRAAAAIEIMHLATLVHDDVIDDAEVRRGISSVQSEFGKKQAVICGDYLFCLAFHTISTVYQPYTEHMLELSKAIGKVCLGELKQHKNNCNVELSTRQYMHIISGKTAALFWLSAYAGAIIGGYEPKEAKLHARYGQYLGIIFQIIDDCKDYELSEEKALKTVNNDIVQGVVTLPLIMAFVKNPELKSIAKKTFYSKRDAASLIAEVYKLGGTKDSRALAYKYSQKARKILQLFNNQKKKEELSKLLDKALGASDKF